MVPLAIVSALIFIVVVVVVSYRGDTSDMPKTAQINTTQIQEIVSQALQDLNSGIAAVIDVRTEQEWQDGHVRGAMHFDLANLQAGNMPNLPKDEKLYVYCKAGSRAGQAKIILEQNGFASVTNAGGLSDWQKAGGTIEK